MKKLTKFLSLTMAALMSVSLVACKSKSKLNALEEDPKQMVSGNQVYKVLEERVTPKLAYTGKNYKSWKKKVKNKFNELLGMDKFKANACPLNVKIEETKKFDAEGETPAYTRYRILFNSEYGATVLCYLLVPDTGKDSYPLAITLQGHSALGVYYSIGDISTKADGMDEDALAEALEYMERGDFARQAVEQGFAALAIEQRGMGDRYADSTPDGASMCEYAANQELMFGRTLIGGRVWDVSKAIDAMGDSVLADATAKVDMSDITITGNSGGGTASFYAACYDSRIDVAAPSCGFGSYKDTIMNTYHCSCNFIPGAYEWFDMQDLACLIAPRKLAVIGGAKDTIFPYTSIVDSFLTIEKIYKKAGKEGNCVYEMSPQGHYWNQNVVWSTINTIRGE